MDFVGPGSALDAIACLSTARVEGVKGLTLDFRRTERAFPEGMMQIAAYVDGLRRAGMHFDLILPEDLPMSRVFEAAGWAHIINPATHDVSAYRGDSQLPVRRYASGLEQQQVVNEAMEIVLHQMEVDRSYLAGLEWSLNEITDNVLNHAEAAGGGLVQVATFPKTGRIQFAVADGGIGILNSMKEGHPELRSDREAIGEAMKQGVTRSNDVGQGNGLAGALRVATQSGGSFAISSGSGELRVIPNEQSGQHEQRMRGRGGPKEFFGTFVFVEIRTDGPLSLEAALDFGKGGGVAWDYLDAIRGDEDDFVIQVAGEAIGFGSRDSGRGLRRKISNMLRAEPSARVVLDWDGIPLVSSSFADEVLGRLFAELGPVQYSVRVRCTAMADDVRRIADRSIMQRAAQELGAPAAAPDQADF